MSFNEQQVAELKNLIKCQDIVRRSENPHPLVIVVIIVVSILVMYCLYVNTVKKTIGGYWMNSDDDKFIITHNKWKDTIVVDNKYPGLVKGHLVVVHMDEKVQMGIWIDNTIKWMNGDIWYA